MKRVCQGNFSDIELLAFYKVVNDFMVMVMAMAVMSFFMFMAMAFVPILIAVTVVPERSLDVMTLVKPVIIN